MDIDTLLEEVGCEALRRVDVLANQAVPMDRIAAITGLDESVVEMILYGPPEDDL